MKKHWSVKLKEDLLLAKQQRNTLYEILKRKGQPETVNEIKTYMETGMEVEGEKAAWSGESSYVTITKNQ